MTKLAINALELAINQYLKLDNKSIEKVRQLDAKILKLYIKPVILFFSFSEDSIKISTDINQTLPTATLEGFPLAFLQLPFLDKEQVPKLFKQELSISGDIEFGQNVRDLFQNIDIDWEEHISTLTGDVVAHELTNFFHTSTNFAKKVTLSVQENLTQYLQEETKHLPCAEEVEDFCDDIDHLKLRVDRLQAKLKETL